jgi:hypothetical protein
MNCIKFKNILFILILAAASVFAQKAVRMNVSATDMFRTDSFELEIKLENFDSEVSVQYPAFTDLTRLSGPFQSSSTSIINGSVTKSVSLSYQFSPKRTGKIVIEPVSVTEGGKTYRSEPVTITVYDQGQNPSGDTAAMFITAEISSKNIYVGEMVKIDYVLYVKPEIRINLPSVTAEPKFTGFVKEPVQIPQEKLRTLVQTIHKGVKYNTLPIRSYWLTPTSSGEKVIEPVSVEVPVEVKTKKKSRGMFNDPFFDDDLFSTFNNFQPKVVLSEEVKLSVNSLPEENRPADFSGAVGSFTIASSLNTDSVAVNEGVNLKVTISGKGNFSDIRELKIKFPKDFEVYDPKRTVSLNPEAKNSGKVIFEYLLLARNPGKHSIKDMIFSYFDIREKKYKTVKASDYIITVSGSEQNYAGSRTGGFSRRDVEVLASDIRYIKKNAHVFYPLAEKPFEAGEFFAWLAVSVALVLISFVSNIYVSRISGDAALSRRKKAAANALKRLKASYRALETKDCKKFYKTLDEALLKFIADKLNISHAGMITDEIVPVLKDKSVSGEIISDFTKLMDKSASIQYASSNPGYDEMAQDIEKAKTLMSELIVRLK